MTVLRGCNSRKNLSRLGPIIAVMLLIAACTRSTPADPTASVTATPKTQSAPVFSTVAPTFEAKTLKPTPAPPAHSVSNAGTIFSSPRYSYTIVLPCCWLALPTPGTAIESAKAQAQAKSEMPLWGDLGINPQDESSGAVLELIALLPDQKTAALPVAQMTVSVLPAHGLSLEHYQTATAKELDNIAKTDVLTSAIMAQLGAGAFPASMIEYRSMPTPTANQAGKTIAGLQLAFFAQDSNNFIVLTFTTTSDRFDELKPQFLHIARSITFEEPRA